METNLFDELYFNEELILFREPSSMLNEGQLIKFKKYVNLEDKTIRLYTELRNHIMHSKPQIIKKKDRDIKEWAGFLKACQNIINFIDGKDAFE